MDSVSCGTEGTSVCDKFESRMGELVKWRMSSGYCWKCSLKTVFRRTVIWTGESVLHSQSSHACCSHSWKNLMVHSSQTLFLPLGIFWSRYWVVEYYNGEYKSQPLQKQWRFFLLCNSQSYPNTNYFTQSWTVAVSCVYLGCTSNTLLKRRVKEWSCRQELVQYMWTYDSFFLRMCCVTRYKWVLYLLQIFTVSDTLFLFYPVQ